MLGPTKRRPGGACPQITTTSSAVVIGMAAISFVWLTCSVSCGLAADAMMVDTQLERFRIRDICSARNVRLYLEYGDSGWVNGYARVRQLEHMVDDFAVKTLTRPKHNNINAKLSNRECTLELVTCPSCRIRVTTSSLNIVNRECDSPPPPIAATNSNWTNENNVNTSSSSANNGGSSSSNSDDDTSGGGGAGGGSFVYPSTHPYASRASNCKCNYIAFVEPPFDSAIGIGQRICNDHPPVSAAVYTGFTRSLMIHFSLSQHSSPEEAFNLTIVAERNLDNTYGSPMDPRRLSHPSHRPSAVIVSPFFPAASTRDLIKQHLITCTAASAANQTLSACSIRVLFSDFQIDLMSRMEFFNSDGDLIHMFTGLAFRPPVIVCDGPSLLMRFYANGGAELRYRAEVDFLPAAAQLAVQPDAVQDAVRPVTECGGSVDTLGGAITMMNMVAANDSQRVHYDCIWIVRPSSRYLNAKPYLSLRVNTFEGFAEHSELVIHEGLTSVHPQLGKLQWSSRSPLKEYVVSTSTGFYVRFRGTFGSAAKLALVYTVFSYESKSPTQFECQNQKRIPLQLQCDGFDHCGDNSDEPESCKLAWKHETYDRRWYSHTPNYYFPKTEHYPDMRAATIVFLVSTVGLVFLISGIVIMLYRMGNWARDHHDMHGHLNTISELLDGNHMDEEEEDIGEDLDPPAYEAPPTYDEVIKVGMDEYYPKVALPPLMRRCGAVVRRTDNTAVVDDENNSSHAIISMTATTMSNSSPDMDTSSDCNLVSLTSLDNLTTPCHIAVLGQHTMLSEAQNTAEATVEMDTAIILENTRQPTGDDVTTSALWSILSTAPTTADIIITDLDTIKGQAMEPDKSQWAVIETVDERNNTDATQIDIDANHQSREAEIVQMEGNIDVFSGEQQVSS